MVAAALFGTLTIVLVAVLGIPHSWVAFARQQEGPQPAPPAQQPAAPLPPSGQQQAPQKQAQAPPPQTSIAVESNLVNVDVVVTNQDGDVLSGLTKDNFRITDDGQPQQITNFAPSEAPITMVILMEFSARFGGYFAYKTRQYSFSILNALTPKDWVALKTFSMRTRVEVDFTQNKKEVAQAINALFFPDFSEANLFDAVLETLDQLRDVKGKKSILVLATGFDTFSKHTLDQTLNRMKETDVPIFCVGMGEEIDLYNAHGRRRGLSAGEKPADHVRQYDRRLRLVSAVRRARCRIFSIRWRRFCEASTRLDSRPTRRRMAGSTS